MRWERRAAQGEEQAERRAGELRVGEQRVGEQRVGEQRVGEQRVGEQRVGEQRVGEQRVGEQRVGVQRVGEQRVGEQRVGDPYEWEGGRGEGRRGGARGGDVGEGGWDGEDLATVSLSPLLSPVPGSPSSLANVVSGAIVPPLLPSFILLPISTFPPLRPSFQLPYGGRHVLEVLGLSDDVATADVEAVIHNLVMEATCMDAAASSVLSAATAALAGAASPPFHFRPLDTASEHYPFIRRRDLETPIPRPATSIRAAQRMIAGALAATNQNAALAIRAAAAAAAAAAGGVAGQVGEKRMEAERRMRLEERRRLKDEAWGDD
ncbi:unnamed protein product [Closterium sp. Naga37s-1]|nr:unnamed protein product [Closterium sp. Naga37s-1]